ncbi:MAG: murein L,D-transpeptidase catalytic domain family protein, partial [Bacteroidia bacterium]|nr:murein L,D-transpeptidase catalytic domain family protein [Bacteroidia bacterium]
SVRLDGLEPGFNDFARERAIVIHAADYVSINFLRKHKRIGRSWGCPAVSKTCMLQIIHATNSPKYWLHYAPNSEWILDSKLF